MVAGAVGALAAVALVVYLVVANTGIFAATEIKVGSSEHVSEAAMQEMLQIPEGTTLLNVDTEAIASSLKANPWVKDVQVERQFPHTLVVTPVEHTVIAVAYISTADVAWAVSDEGTWIAPLALGTETGTLSGDEAAQGSDGDSEDASSEGDQSTDGQASADGSAEDAGSGEAGAASGGDAAAGGSDGSAEGSAADSATASGSEEDPDASAQAGYDAALKLAQDLGAFLITDIGTDVNPVPGESVSAEGVSAALEYANEFSDDFRSQVTSFSAASVESLSLFTTGGVEVALGAAEDIAYKETVIKRILSDNPNVTYINVRTPDSPTWRNVSL